ncbi:MAG: hypothetical protein ABJF01_12365 [bacterium]
MSTRSRLFLAGALIALGSACAHPTSTTERPDRNVITQEQMAGSKYLTVYDAVQALRSNWLSTRGPDSFANPTQVRVYLDNTLLGGVETLKTITVSTISFIKHFDGISATARWGLDHGAGVIFVSTRPASATNPH